VRTPAALRMSSSGQKPVNPLCRRFRPTKPVKRKKYLETYRPARSEARTKDPATMRTIFSVHMGASCGQRRPASGRPP
jgi:hypothetical protein